MPDFIEGREQKLSELIIQDFNLESEQSLNQIDHLNELKEKLEKIVAYLLDNDFERLLSAMYRLDINEEKFKMALSGIGKNAVSAEITDLIISREIQKLKTRIKYNKN
jgi:hypothetical protein